MSDIVTDRSIKRAIVVRPETTNIVTFNFSASIAAFTWSLVVRKVGTETNVIYLTEGDGLTKSTTQLVADFDPVTITANEYYWFLRYSGAYTYLLTNGAFKIVNELYLDDPNESEAITVNLNGTDVTLTILPWPV